MFRQSVTVLTHELQDMLSSGSSELCKHIFRGNNHVDWNGVPTNYICSTCKKEVKKGNLPAMARENNLEIKEVDERGIELTELESNLIARTILFQKIYQLPKSRMAACKDRLINIPINEDDVKNTITNLPRTPKEAGLLEVKLKRKIEYKNTHQHAYIDPEKIFRALAFLKKSGHPDYTFYENIHTYEKRCALSLQEIKFVSDSNVDKILDKETFLESQAFKQYTGNLNNDAIETCREKLNCDYVEDDDCGT